MVVIQTLFTNLTPLNGLFTNCDICLVSRYLGVIVTGATCGAGNAHSGHLFHPLWGVHDFTHSLYIHYIISQFKDK